MKAIEKELKSCPFCGGEAVLKFEPYYSYVKCKNCGAETGLVKATPRICAADEAAKVWNTRVDEPAADVQEVKHGEWQNKYKSGTTVKEGVVSSCCDMWNNRKSQFCPNCGARMDGDGE